MPNWCWNTLVVEGASERLRAFDNQFKAKHTAYTGGRSFVGTDCIKDERLVKAIAYRLHETITYPQLDGTEVQRVQVEILDHIEEIEGYSFQNFVPMTQNDFLNGWYYWCRNHWGTKWDICDDDITDDLNFDRGAIFYGFDTAWSPCCPVVQAMAAQYPDLDFSHEYDEEGVGFAGQIKYANGECIEAQESGDADDYRKFRHEVLGADYLKCTGCGALLEEYEVEDHTCPDCGCGRILDYDGETILEADSIEKPNPKDEDHYTEQYDDTQVIAQITWTISDLKDSLLENGFNDSIENIKKVLDGSFKKCLEEQSTATGWEIIETIINFTNGLDPIGGPNTRICYMYRDGNNFKESEEFVLAGHVTWEDLEPYLDEGLYFIPSQAGLVDLQKRMLGFPTDADHVWHELTDVEFTDNKPTIELRAEQLLANFKSVERWDVEGVAKKLGIVI